MVGLSHPTRHEHLRQENSLKNKKETKKKRKKKKVIPGEPHPPLWVTGASSSHISSLYTREDEGRGVGTGSRRKRKGGVHTDHCPTQAHFPTVWKVLS